MAMNIAPGASARRFKYGLSVALFLAGLLVLLAGLNYLAASTSLRWDLTAGRRYSLSPMTRTLLDGLDSPCEIAVVFSEEVERAGLAQQVNDVLREFEQYGDKVVITRIDPQDAAAGSRFDQLLERIRGLYAEEVSGSEEAIAAGSTLLERLQAAAEEEAAWLEPWLPQIDGADPQARAVSSIAEFLMLAPQQMARSAEQVTRLMEPAPLPDWAGARSQLQSILNAVSQNVLQIAEYYRQFGESESLPEGLRADAAVRGAALTALADEAADAAESLQDLPEMEITPLARALEESNSVVVMAGGSATVVPFDRLFPPPTPAEIEQEQRFDQRFAGEGVIAAAIRRLSETSMPTVIFCHVEQRASVLRPNEPGNVAMAAELLRDQGYEVIEWNAMGGGRPQDVDRSGGDPVWVMVTPPLNLSNPMANQAQEQLALLAAQLVAEGENVLINVTPDFLAGFGAQGTWDQALGEVGLAADRARLLIQQSMDPGRGARYSADFPLREYSEGHPIGEALDGVDTRLTFITPLSVADAEAGEHWPILEVPGGENVWAEANWQSASTIEAPSMEGRPASYPVVMAAQRDVAGDPQRVIAVGAAGWFLTQELQQMMIVSPAIIPAFPGNAELLANSVNWLAFQDGLIARSALTQSVARVTDLSEETNLRYRWLLVGGLPLLSLLLGVVVWILRRG